MFRFLIALIIVLSASMFVLGQTRTIVDSKSSTGGAKDFAAEIASAKLALAAHGGEKLRGMKTLVVRGAVDVTTSAIAQAIPATFVTIFAGDKYRIEIRNPFQPLKQVYDGTQTSSTIQGGSHSRRSTGSVSRCCRASANRDL